MHIKVLRHVFLVVANIAAICSVAFCVFGAYESMISLFWSNSESTKHSPPHVYYAHFLGIDNDLEFIVACVRVGV